MVKYKLYNIIKLKINSALSRMRCNTSLEFNEVSFINLMSSSKTKDNDAKSTKCGKNFYCLVAQQIIQISRLSFASWEKVG